MKAQKIKVGSDFSGVGAFDQALIRLGIEYKTVFACDIDKFARETYIYNYGKPDYYPGNVYGREIPSEPLDIYMTSPPCQAFSLAGKRKGEDDEKGVLFYNSHEFITKNKPRYFIFENVKGLLSDNGGKTFQRWIDLLGGKSVNGNPVIFPMEGAVPYHVYYKVLNAKDFGVPQNRERIFIVGIRDDEDNNFSWPKPMHLTKRLKDVLEDNVDEKYYLSEKQIEYMQGSKFEHSNRIHDTNKASPTLTTMQGGGQEPKIKVKSATSKGYEIAKEGDSINLSQPNSETRRGRVGKEVAQTLDTSCNQAVMIGAFRGRNPENTNDRTTGAPMQQTLEINKHGTSNTITSVQKDNVVCTPVISNYRSDNPINSNGNVFKILLANAGGKTRGLGIYHKYKIRKLTPRECFRLMDFPESFTWPVSNSQAYKQAGNSIVVNVLAGILRKLLK